MPRRKAKASKHLPKGVVHDSPNLLRIAVATAPQAADAAAFLTEDIRLLKPALLYADEVTLYSPGAVLLSMMSGIGMLTEAGRLSLLKQLYPILDPEHAPNVLSVFKAYDQMAKRKRGRSREDLLSFHALRSEMMRVMDHLNRTWEEEAVPMVEELLETSGANQLGEALSRGLLIVNPLIDGEDFDIARLTEGFVSRVGATLSSRGTYPLFDDQTGRLVRHGIDEGAFTPSAVFRSRGKQVAVASGFLGRMPTFPSASLSEVLDIRTELAPGLVRFRAATAELGRLIEADAYDEAFTDQVDDVFVEKVAPALLEIEERVRENAYLRNLIGHAVGDTKTLLAGILAFGIAGVAELPTLLTAGVVAGGQAAVQAAWDRHEANQDIRKHDMYFLHQTEQLLSNPN